MKKGIFSILFAFLIIGASIQTYASTVLDTNIIALIENGISHFVNLVIPEDEEVIDDENNNFDAGKYIDQKNDELSDDLTEYKNQKVSETNQELADYIDQVKKQINDIYQEKNEEAKKNFDQKLDDEVERIKQKILDDLMKKLDK